MHGYMILLVCVVGLKTPQQMIRYYLTLRWLNISVTEDSFDEIQRGEHRKRMIIVGVNNESHRISCPQNK